MANGTSDNNNDSDSTGSTASAGDHPEQGQADNAPIGGASISAAPVDDAPVNTSAIDSAAPQSDDLERQANQALADAASEDDGSLSSSYFAPEAFANPSITTAATTAPAKDIPANASLSEGLAAQTGYAAGGTAFQNRQTRKTVSQSGTRLPPHSIESEQAVLGALLIAQDSYDQVADILTEAAFYQFDHRLIFRAIAALTEANQPTDVVTVTGWLEQNAVLSDAGGLHYISALAEESPGATNIKAYAGIVQERAILRELISASNDIADAAFTPDGRNSKDLLDFAESRVFSIADETVATNQGFNNIKSVLAGTLDRLSYLFETQQAITGVATGFTELDEKTSGLQSSDLVIIAGRPSMGKTSFAMNIAEHAALTGEHPVAVFSMEMPAQQLAMRMIASLGRIELQKLRTGRLAEQDWTRVTGAIGQLTEKRNLFIDDSPALTPTDLRARARRLKREHNGLQLIVVDYLQLMRVHGSVENKATEIAEISRSLKALAKELDVPVIALSQLNRSLEQRPDKRPVMSDLRESGAIEQDADMIMFVYREEVYEPDKEEVKGVAEILIRKQRNGPIGSVKLTFLGANTRFENFSPELAAAQQFAAGRGRAPGLAKAPDTVSDVAPGAKPALAEGGSDATPNLENF